MAKHWELCCWDCHWPGNSDDDGELPTSRRAALEHHKKTGHYVVAVRTEEVAYGDHREFVGRLRRERGMDA